MAAPETQVEQKLPCTLATGHAVLKETAETTSSSSMVAAKPIDSCGHINIAAPQIMAAGIPLPTSPEPLEKQDTLSSALTDEPALPPDDGSPSLESVADIEINSDGSNTKTSQKTMTDAVTPGEGATNVGSETLPDELTLETTSSPDDVPLTPITSEVSAPSAWALPALSLDFDWDFGAEDCSSVLLPASQLSLDLGDAHVLDDEKGPQGELPLPVFRSAEGEESDQMYNIEPHETGELRSQCMGRPGGLTNPAADSTPALSPTSTVTVGIGMLDDRFVETTSFVNEFSHLQSPSADPELPPNFPRTRTMVPEVCLGTRASTIS